MSDDRPPPSSFDETELHEKPFKKLSRRFKEEPLIPLGVAATCYALWRAYRSYRARDSVQLNKMFRARIYAQGFTVMACAGGGLYYGAERQQKKALQQAVDEKKAEEKREAWLRELEIRDREDREWREKHDAIARAAKEAESRDPRWGGSGANDTETATAVQETKEKSATDAAVSAPVEQEAAQKEKAASGGVLSAAKGLVTGKK